MKKGKIKSVASFLLCLAVALQFFGCGLNKNNNNSTITQPTAQSSTELSTISENAVSAGTNNLEKSLDLSNAKTITLGSQVTAQDGCALVSGNTAAISEAGTYIITGKSNNAQIVVNTKDTEDVYLAFNNADITYLGGSPIYIKKANNTFIVLLSQTENYITDSSSYTFDDTADSEPDAAIFCKNDLTIGGSGTLNITGNYLDGIKCKDDLVISGGIINVTAVKNGIKARDSLTVTAGIISIKAGNDGIKTTNNTQADKGYININGGEISINSTGDGVQAETDLNLNNAKVNVTSGGGYDNASQKTAWGSSSEDTSSAKGLKAANNITVNSGEITINSADDAIHSNSNTVIKGGNLSLSSGDDGIHCDTSLKISSGTINVKQSYEGLEAETVEISGGTITITASDDGINAAGGNDSSGFGGAGPGRDNFNTTNSSSKLVISGGYLFVNAGGDGVDSNGTITVSGGTSVVVGPSNGGNSCIDSEGGLTYTGGTIVGISSSSAMWAQDVIGHITGDYIFNTSVGNVNQGQTIAVTDKTGNVVAIVKPSISGNLGIICLSDKASSISDYKFVIGGTYSKALDSNGYGTSGTISSGTTVGPQSESDVQGGMGGNMGGFRR